MSDCINLSIDPRAQPRCRLTGTIPSAEEGMMHGAEPQPRQLVVDMGQLSPEEQEVAMNRQRKTVSGSEPVVDIFEPSCRFNDDCPGVFVLSLGQLTLAVTI